MTAPAPGPGLSPPATVDALALVPAYNEAGRVAATVEALVKLPEVAEVLVVDDGSADGTSKAALDAGAHCLVLPGNRGKGAALNAGLAALLNRVAERVTPRPRALLLADADLGDTAGRLGALLAPVLDGTADLAIADLPAQEGAGGFGLAVGLARAGIKRRTGQVMGEPLSGQRAIRWEVLESGVLGPFAPRFGVEVAMTVRALRAGLTVTEVEVDLRHAATGKDLAGIRHRASQAAAIARELARDEVAGWGKLPATAHRRARIDWTFGELPARARAGLREIPARRRGRTDRNGQDRNGQDRNGQDRNGQDRNGQDRNGQDRKGT